MVPFRPYLEITNLARVYLLAVTLVAARFGRGPSVLASVLSVAAFDFFCVPPYMTFAIRDTPYGLTFVVMFAIALVISALTTRITEQAQSARERELRTSSLYEVSRSLVHSSETRELLAAGARHVSETFGGEAALYLPDALGRLTPSIQSPSGFEREPQEVAVATWVHLNARAAGLATDTLPGAKALHVPLSAPGGVVGVLAVRPVEEPRRFRDPEQLHLLEAFAALIAVAVERSRLAEDARRVRQLEEMDRLKSEFVTAASHDLREPLRELAAELARAGGSSPEVGLARLGERVERLRRLVDDLLDLSKLESGRAELARHPVAPAALLEETLHAFRERAEEKGVEMTAVGPSDGQHVLAAREEIRRVLATLVSNALQFTDAGGRIIVSADPIGDVVQFSVADDGKEIPLEEQARLFDRFVPLAKGGRQEGTGLGLPIARGIVKAHGGQIWVDSGPGPGCVFSFTLPIAEPTTDSEQRY